MRGKRWMSVVMWSWLSAGLAQAAELGEPCPLDGMDIGTLGMCCQGGTWQRNLYPHEREEELSRYFTNRTVICEKIYRGNPDRGDFANKLVLRVGADRFESAVLETTYLGWGVPAGPYRVVSQISAFERCQTHHRPIAPASLSLSAPNLWLDLQVKPGLFEIEAMACDKQLDPQYCQIHAVVFAAKDCRAE